MALQGWSSYFTACLLFLSLFFFACRHYSADSLLNPSPRLFSSQAVTALLFYGRHPKDVVCGICWGIWYICCSGELWGFLPHAPLCVPVDVRVGCQLCSRPPEQGALDAVCLKCIKNTSVLEGWPFIFWANGPPADRIFINFSGLYDGQSWKLIDVFGFSVLSLLQLLWYRALDLPVIRVMHCINTECALLPSLYTPAPLQRCSIILVHWRYFVSSVSFFLNCFFSHVKNQNQTC